MTSSSNCAWSLLPVVACCGLTAAAQAIPADPGTSSPSVGFSLPRIGGSLSYAVNASELISNGFFNSSGAEATTNFSGDLAYISKSAFHPFSAVYAGGVLIANSGQPTTVYQSLAFSQVLSTKRWNIVLSDSVSYLPESPAVGLSGIPGVGDLGVDPVSVVVSNTPGLGILTTYGPRVSNSTAVSVSRSLSAHLSAQGSGTYSIQRFLGDNASQAINTTTEGGSGGLTYRPSARDSFAANYSYNYFSFSGSPLTFSTQGASLSYSRQWSRRFTTSVFGGPQISSSSSPLLNGSFTSFSAGAGASYATRTTAYTLSFNRGVNNGSGVLPGSFADSLSLSAHRRFGRAWSVSGNVSYSRSTSLPLLNAYTFSSDSTAVGGQAARLLGRYFSMFASYTLEDQRVAGSGVGALTPNAFNGLYQVFGIGISYSPRNILLSR